MCYILWAFVGNECLLHLLGIREMNLNEFRAIFFGERISEPKINYKAFERR